MSKVITSAYIWSQNTRDVLEVDREPRNLVYKYAVAATEEMIIIQIDSNRKTKAFT